MSSFTESEILETHNEAFSDYEVPMQISLESFRNLNRRRGVSYNLSLGAVDGEKLVGFILNAIDYWEDKLTAYDCGTGVIPDYRQKGVGNRIFSELLPILQAENIEQYLLEVIQSNTAAYNLYKKRNFQITRKFDCLMAEIKEIKSCLHNSRNNPLAEKYDIREINSIDWNYVINFWDYPPSWQNSNMSVQRLPNSFNYLGAFSEENLVGYLVYEPNGGLTQIAVSKNKRNQGIGTELIKYLIKQNSNVDKLSIINVDTRDNSLLGFIKCLGFNSFITQFEMNLKIK
ncbi:MAG: GNAT family N-acetyltransferase [Promethearchaeota archaeon]